MDKYWSAAWILAMLDDFSWERFYDLNVDERLCPMYVFSDNDDEAPSVSGFTNLTQLLGSGVNEIRQAHDMGNRKEVKRLVLEKVS